MNIKDYHQQLMDYYYPPISVNGNNLVRLKFENGNHLNVDGVLTFGRESLERYKTQGKNVILVNDFAVKYSAPNEITNSADGFISFYFQPYAHEHDYIGRKIPYAYGIKANHFLITNKGKILQKSQDLCDTACTIDYTTQTITVEQNGNSVKLHDGDRIILTDNELVIPDQDTDITLHKIETPVLFSKNDDRSPLLSVSATKETDILTMQGQNLADMGLLKTEYGISGLHGWTVASWTRFARNQFKNDKYAFILYAYRAVSSFRNLFELAYNNNLRSINYRLADVSSPDVVKGFKMLDDDYNKNLKKGNARGDASSVLNRKETFWEAQVSGFFRLLEETPCESTIAFTIPQVKKRYDVNSTEKLITRHNTNHLPYKLNAMIETRAATANLRRILPVIDKPIIGLNDTTSWVTGIDRTDTKSIEAYKQKHGFNPFQIVAPEVLEVVSTITEHAHKAGKQVAVAGDHVSSDSQGLLEIMRLGVDEIILPPEPVAIQTARYAKTLL